MARTKQTLARRMRRPDRCQLLQLMGFPRSGGATVDPAEARADWAAVAERLAGHPNEAMHAERWAGRPPLSPLQLALVNERTPVTREALEALIRAHPRALVDITDDEDDSALKNGDDTGTRRRGVSAVMRQAKRSYHCGRNRTSTFQLMGFPASCEEEPQGCYYDEHLRGGEAFPSVDWLRLERHLESHPEEAKIMCPVGRSNCYLFPLELALKIARPHVPLMTVQLLLRLCPEAANVADSPALYYACCLRGREDPNVIRAVLRANPSLAASTTCEGFQMWEDMGLPIHDAVRLRCAAQVLPDLIEACPASLEAQTDLWFHTPLRAAAELWSRLPTDVWKLLLESGHRHGACVNDGGGQLFAVGGVEQYGRENVKSAMEEIMETPGNEDDGRQWGNVCLALRAAGAHRTRMSAEDMWEYPLIHAAVEFGGRRRFIFERVWRETDRQERDSMDAAGRTPLAVAIGSASREDYSYLPCVDEDDDEEEEDILKLGTVIRRLLDNQTSWPQSGRIPIPGKDGRSSPRLPLHEALHRGIGIADGIEHILNAYPAALSIPEPTTRLIPCLLAAVVEGASVDTIFGLMMRRPDLIVDLCKHCLEGHRSDDNFSKKQKCHV